MSKCMPGWAFLVEWQIATVFLSDSETLHVLTRDPAHDDGHDRPALYTEDTEGCRDWFYDYPVEEGELCGRGEKRWIPVSYAEDWRSRWNKLKTMTEYQEREREFLRSRPAIVKDIVENGGS